MLLASAMDSSFHNFIIAAVDREFQHDKLFRDHRIVQNITTIIIPHATATMRRRLQ
jgi:hypothetical protein